jgi:hypothetical protein
MRRKSLVAVLLGAVAFGLVVLATGSPAQPRAGEDTRVAAAGWGLPGVPVAQVDLPPRAQAGVRAAVAISPQVDATSVRTVTRAGRFGRALTLLAAAGPGGRPCFTFVADNGGTREFSCTGEGASALVRFLSFGGASLESVDWVTLTGIARSGVRRVGLVTVGGSEIDLRLDRWGAFGYTTDARTGVPVALRAYDAAGALVEEVRASP